MYIGRLTAHNTMKYVKSDYDKAERFININKT